LAIFEPAQTGTEVALYAAVFGSVPIPAADAFNFGYFHGDSYMVMAMPSYNRERVMGPGAKRVTRPTAVAGTFYPADRNALKETIRGLLAAVPVTAGMPAPKAVIVPHAGYAYSGAVAASAYSAIGPLREKVCRVVLIGPSHFKTFVGIAAPSADVFATPLGVVAVDREGVDALVKKDLIAIDDEAHREEHALEVQLPFLIAQLGTFTVVPLLVGDAPAEAVAAVLGALWEGRETLIVVSSDLSHYHRQETAMRLDRATAAVIESLESRGLTGEDACGYQAVAGLLLAARRHRLAVRRLDLRTSADTAGSMGRVVGYGAWALAAARGR
jgi:AmmeMemoRadiSam system protein B